MANLFDFWRNTLINWASFLKVFQAVDHEFKLFHCLPSSLKNSYQLWMWILLLQLFEL